MLLIIKNIFKAKGFVSFAFMFLCCNFYSQSILDSINKFYNRETLSYSFTETRYLSKGIITYTGKLISYTEGSTLFFKIDFSNKEFNINNVAIKNRNYYGRNEGLKNKYVDYKLRKENAFYFHDGNTPGHILMQNDTSLRKLFNSDYMSIMGQKDNYLLIYNDTVFKPTNIDGLLYRSVSKYTISKQNYSVLKSEYEITNLIGKVETKTKSEFVYTYYDLPFDTIYKRIDAFIPLATSSPKKEANLELPDSVKKFPPFNLKDTLSKTVTNKEITSRFVLIDFWYKDCAPCLANMKNLKRIRGVFDKKDIEIIIVNAKDPLSEVTKKMVSKFDNGCLFLFDGRGLAKSLSIKAYPIMIIYDNATRKIIYHHIGTGVGSTQRLIDLLKDYLRTQ